MDNFGIILFTLIFRFIFLILNYDYKVLFDRSLLYSRNISIQLNWVGFFICEDHCHFWSSLIALLRLLFYVTLRIVLVPLQPVIMMESRL